MFYLMSFFSLFSSKFISLWNISAIIEGNIKKMQKKSNLINNLKAFSVND